MKRAPSESSCIAAPFPNKFAEVTECLHAFADTVCSPVIGDLPIEQDLVGEALAHRRAKLLSCYVDRTEELLEFGSGDRRADDVAALTRARFPGEEFSSPSAANQTQRGQSDQPRTVR
jgi:hypothetical protein